MGGAFGHLRFVLTLQILNEFFANFKRCSFGRKKVEYLGHIISGAGVTMDRKKVDVVLKWLVPKTVKLVKGFLGLAGYYRRFIEGYGRITRPLTNLLKKEGFKWGKDSAEAFTQLQKALTTAPVPTLPDFSQPFTIECDASSKGIGVMFSLNKKVVAYFSKRLSEASLRKSVYEKKVNGFSFGYSSLEVIFGGQKIYNIYLSKEFKIFTRSKDNYSKPTELVAKLLGYEFDIVYKTGATNKVADALSRREKDKELQRVIKPYLQGVNNIDREVEADPILSKIKEDL